MAKFFGKIGYSTTTETAPGVWTPSIVAIDAFGDVLKEYVKQQTGDGVNDNVTVNNKISIIADAYALHNTTNMAYVEWLEQRWKVESVDVVAPRLHIRIGGVYNGPTPTAT